MKAAGLNPGRACTLSPVSHFNLSSLISDHGNCSLPTQNIFFFSWIEESSIGVKWKS